MPKKILQTKTVFVPANSKVNLPTMNGWEAESDAATLLNGLGIRLQIFTMLMMRELHGRSEGQGSSCTRPCLAIRISCFLDEPTNHLDLDAIAWLEEFLINFEQYSYRCLP